MKKWVKILGVLSIILIIGLIVLAVQISSTSDGLGAALVIGLILGPSLLFILFAWGLGFLLAYLKNKNKTLANILSILGLIFFGGVFIVSMLGFFDVHPFYRFDIMGWFAWPLQLLIVIYFIVSTIIINKKD